MSFFLLQPQVKKACRNFRGLRMVELALNKVVLCDKEIEKVADQKEKVVKRQQSRCDLTRYWSLDSIYFEEEKSLGWCYSVTDFQSLLDKSKLFENRFIPSVTFPSEHVSIFSRSVYSAGAKDES